MSNFYIIASIAVMSLTTYLVRMVPFVAFRKQIKSRFVKSLLYYMPYAVLGAMTIPYIFYSTGSFVTALVGFSVAFLLSYFNKSLITVAVFACIAAFATGLITSYLPL